MKYKNYYKILELKGPSVSDDEIKASFHKLAKVYHPDINPQQAEAFKEINEAYQVLGDKDKKRRYNIRYRFHTMQNIDFDSGISEFAAIFVGKDEIEEELVQQPTNELDDTIILSITREDIENGAVKTINYSLPSGKSKKLTIKIPTNSKSGTQIKLKGEGRAVEDTNQKGDLNVIIDVINVDVDIKL